MVLSSGMYLHAVRWKLTDVSEEFAPSILWFEAQAKEESSMKHVAA
jgi:hypothetical protein